MMAIMVLFTSVSNMTHHPCPTWRLIRIQHDALFVSNMTPHPYPTIRLIRKLKMAEHHIAYENFLSTVLWLHFFFKITSQ